MDNKKEGRTDNRLIPVGERDLITTSSSLVKRGLGLLSFLPKNILVLNDDIRILKNFKRIIEGDNHRCDIFTNSQDALDSLRGGQTDIFIQDVGREDINGLEFYWIMKSEKTLREIPIIIASSWRPNVSIKKTKKDLPVNKPLNKIIAIFSLEYTNDDLSSHQKILNSVAEIKNGNEILVEALLEFPFSPLSLMAWIRHILKARNTSDLIPYL